MPLGSATRSGAWSPVASAVWPAWSTTSAWPVSRATIGAATLRSRSSAPGARPPPPSHSAGRRARPARARPGAGPGTVRSRRRRRGSPRSTGPRAAPRRSPRCACDSTKCSAPRICTASPSTRAVPIALVPTLRLGPRGAADEAEPVGHPSYAGVADLPQHPAVGVGDHDQLAGVDGGGERLGQRGHPRRQPARRTTPLEVGLGQRRDARAHRPDRPRSPPPGARTRRSRCGARARSRPRPGPRPGSGAVRARPRRPRRAPSAGRCNPLQPFRGTRRRCVLAHTA